ncbi:hypothetical protein PTTG_00607, partial [Puccinia triticina 1-1 BBBD Race 1]
MLCNDGIALPCGRLELESGPWRIQGIIPSCLLDFLANPQIVKLGVGICNDGLKLLRDHKLGPKPFLNSFLKISRLARALGQPDCASGYSCLISLQQIIAKHLKLYLPKPNTGRATGPSLRA